MAAASYGLNARSLRALELTQAAWRRDRFGVRGKGGAEQPGGLRALIPGELRLVAEPNLGWGYRGDERRSRSWPWPSTTWT